MTIRLVVDGREAARRQIVERLVSLSNGEIEIAFYVGDVGEDINGPDLNRMRPPRRGRKPAMQALEMRGVDLPLILSPDFHQMVETAIDQLQRSDSTYRYRSHNLRNLQDYLDYYHLLAEAFASRLVSSQATHVLFMNVPHVGYDTILYQVSRALGLETTVLYQSLFPNQFFSMSRIEDLGTVGDLEALNASPMKIEKGSGTNLFYMDERWQEKAPRGKVTWNAIGRFLQSVLVRDPKKLLNVSYMMRTLSRIAALYEKLPDWRDPFAKFFHDNEFAYFEHLAEFEQEDFDLEANFVYVSLQNQPELSTSALGGIWRDQLLMIEALSRDLPVGWKIYVKENPRQTAFARGPLFFHRLKRIHGVRFLPSHANTHALSSHAKFTASVTSNACWESVCTGKPAIAFGRAWYRSLPGIVRWQAGLDFEEIVRTEINHSALEHAAGTILALSHSGVLETVYTKIVEGFDSSSNTELVAETLLDLLTNKLPLSFSDIARSPQ